MARNIKVGIDYFSHDVDMIQDKKLKIVKAKFGLLGYAVYLRLLEEIYRDLGYYIIIDDDFNILFSDECNIPFNDYILIKDECINKGLFSEKLYKKYNILTSSRIQSNYCAATERRREVTFLKEYLLIDVSQMYNKEKVNVNINSINDNINQVNDDKSTQSKEKESKEKESKEKESKETTYPEKFLKLWDEYPNTNGSKSQTFKNWQSCKKELGLSDNEIHTACINSAGKQESEGKSGKYIYQLSNVLGRNYKNDLPDLLKWVPKEAISSDYDLTDAQIDAML